MLVGEAPGKQEDLQGLPFVGPSGKFLDSLLKSVKLSRKDIYITSSVKCRPPKNRTPRPDELRICKTNWLDRQISLIAPKIIVLLGKTAVKQVLSLDANLNRLHGQLISKDHLHCFITFHPAAAMRFPQIGAKTQKDFRKLKQLLNTQTDLFSNCIAT